MSYNPYARYTYGGELRHWNGRGRKPIELGGAPNGFSNIPGRKPVGTPRTSERKFINGKWVYVDPNWNPKAAQGANLARTQMFANSKIGQAVSPVNMQRQRERNLRNGVQQRQNDLRNLNQQQANNNLRVGVQNRDSDLRNLNQQQENERLARDRYNRSFAGRVTNWFNQRGDEARNTAKNVGNWIGDRANNVRTAVGNAWDGKAGSGSSKASYEALNRNAMNYLNRAKQMEKTGNTAKAQEYRNKYRQAAAQADKERNTYNNSIRGRMETAGRNVGNWLNTARGNATDWFNKRGDEARATLNRIDEAWDGKVGRGSAKDNANEYYKEGMDREAQKELERYNNTVRGRIERAGRDAGNWLNTARGNVSKTASNIGGQIGERAGKLASDAKRTANKVRRAAGEAWDGKAGSGSAKDEAAKMRQKGLSSKDVSQKKMAFDLGDQYAKKYSKSIKGQAEKRINDASEFVKNVAKGTTKVAKNPAKFVSNVAGNVSKGVGAVKTTAQTKIEAANAEREYNKAKDKVTKLSDRMEALSQNDPKFYEVQEEYNRVYAEEYLPAQTNWNKYKK